MASPVGRAHEALGAVGHAVAEGFADFAFGQLAVEELAVVRTIEPCARGRFRWTAEIFQALEAIDRKHQTRVRCRLD